MACLVRLCELPETEGPRKGVIWGLPNWMIAAILLWVALYNPNSTNGLEEPEKIKCVPPHLDSRTSTYHPSLS